MPTNATAPTARRPVPLPRTVTLNGRTDFPQHFTISAALAAHAGTPLSDAIGVRLEGVDLHVEQPTDVRRAVRTAWLDHALVLVRGQDLDVDEHNVICLIGASGSGKSTLLRCINMLETPSAGSIRIAGHGTARTRRSHQTPTSPTTSKTRPGSRDSAGAQRLPPRSSNDPLS